MSVFYERIKEMLNELKKPVWPLSWIPPLKYRLSYYNYNHINLQRITKD